MAAVTVVPRWIEDREALAAYLTSHAGLEAALRAVEVLGPWRELRAKGVSRMVCSGAGSSPEALRDLLECVRTPCPGPRPAPALSRPKCWGSVAPAHPAPGSRARRVRPPVPTMDQGGGGAGRVCSVSGMSVCTPAHMVRRSRCTRPLHASSKPQWRWTSDTRACSTRSSALSGCSKALVAVKSAEPRCRTRCCKQLYRTSETAWPSRTGHTASSSSPCPPTAGFFPCPSLLNTRATRAMGRARRRGPTGTATGPLPGSAGW